MNGGRRFNPTRRWLARRGLFSQPPLAIDRLRPAGGAKPVQRTYYRSPRLANHRRQLTYGRLGVSPHRLDQRLVVSLPLGEPAIAATRLAMGIGVCQLVAAVGLATATAQQRFRRRFASCAKGPNKQIPMRFSDHHERSERRSGIFQTSDNGGKKWNHELQIYAVSAATQAW
jgi:hypothetical protein